MASPLDFLLIGPRLVGDIARIADAAVRTGEAAERLAQEGPSEVRRINEIFERLLAEMAAIRREIEAVRSAVDGVHAEVEGVRASTEQLPANTDRMADSFDRSNDELEALRKELRPMIREVQETSDPEPRRGGQRRHRAAAPGGRAAREDRRAPARPDEAGLTAGADRANRDCRRDRFQAGPARPSSGTRASSTVAPGLDSTTSVAPSNASRSRIPSRPKPSAR
jgi:hypothetical protein